MSSLRPPRRSPRFFEDLKDMLGFAPYRFYYYMWKYITPILLLGLLGSSVVQLAMTPPGYSAWIQESVSERLPGAGTNGGRGLSHFSETWNKLKAD